MSAGVEIHRLTVAHGDTTLVDVADLRLEPGRPLTIVGESGSGKSLLAHAVMGTLAGNLQVAGAMSVGWRRHDLADRSGRRHLWGRQMALLPQEPAQALDPTMRVLSQVAEGVPRFPASRGAAFEHARTALAGVGLAHVGSAYPHTLSGGMAQRVAYAAATAGGAGVLIVDEPSKGLDPVALDRLAQLLADHAAAGGMLLTITHDLRLARRLGGRVAVMLDAAIVEEGPAEQVLARPRHSYTRRLLAAEPSRWRHPWTTRQGGTPTAAPGEPLLAATGLGKGYGDQPLFDDLSLEIRAGERWALTGPSGVGKTTLGNVLLGLARPDRGTVRRSPVLGGGRVQKLYQDPGLSFPPRVPLGRSLHDVRRRHGVPGSWLHERLDRVGLTPGLLDRRPDQVSGGELQRLAILRAMMPRPALVFADEPTSRLDLVTQETTMDCLMSELAETGCALLIVTHDVALASVVTEHRVDLGPGTHTVVPAGAAATAGARQGTQDGTPPGPDRDQDLSAPTSWAPSAK